MIEVNGLTKQYGNKVAISDITFDVQPGEILGFLGPNGAGKSTTMRILSGYMPASAGTARVAGFDVFSQSLDARRNIGYLPENVPLYTDMTVRSYIAFMAEIRGVPRGKIRSSVDRSMTQARVLDRADWIISKLSKGYRQRVGLAQALVHSPKVLILDEPTVGLDPRQIIETRNLIKSLGGEQTVILSTHILPEVSATCSRVVIIANGRVVAMDTTDNLTRRMAGSDRVELEIGGPGEGIIGRLSSVPSVQHVEIAEETSGGRHRVVVDCVAGIDVRAELAAAVISSGWSLYQMRNVNASLEDVFINLTTEEAPATSAEFDDEEIDEDGENDSEDDQSSEITKSVKK